MPRNYFIFLLIPFSLGAIENVKKSIDCHIVTGGITECSPYQSTLLYTQKVKYDDNKKKLIVSKTLPVPKKKKVKVISVADMIEKYVKVEESVRFKGTKETILNKMIQNITQVDQHTETPTTHASSRKTHTLERVRAKKTHTLQRYVGDYKIVCGDSLSKIAYKFNVSKTKLQHLNHLGDDVTIKLGQKFKIPLPQKMIDAIANAKYTVDTGDTLLSVAAKFHLNPKDLVEFNHIKSSTNIQKGKTLKLPLPYVLKELEKKKKEKVKQKKLEQMRLAKLKEKKRHVKMLRVSGKRKLRVTATAYTSHRRQTDSTPFIAAWNNHIKPGMKILAVSRDLITRYGLRNGTKVRIGGLPGHYVVRDKMNKRYRRRIDIYMGLNKRRAYRWGRRSVIIQY